MWTSLLLPPAPKTLVTPLYYQIDEVLVIHISVQHQNNVLYLSIRHNLFWVSISFLSAFIRLLIVHFLFTTCVKEELLYIQLMRIHYVVKNAQYDADSEYVSSVGRL